MPSLNANSGVDLSLKAKEELNVRVSPGDCAVLEVLSGLGLRPGFEISVDSARSFTFPAAGEVRLKSQKSSVYYATSGGVGGSAGGGAGVNTDFTDAELQAKAAVGELIPLTDYAAYDTKVRYWAPDAYTLQRLAGTAVIQSSGNISANTLVKSGLGKVYDIVQFSGAGKPTVRNGTSVAGALVSGWGDGGASGLTLSAGVPYAPSLAPTDFPNGIFVEINGTATVVVHYQ